MCHCHVSLPLLLPRVAPAIQRLLSRIDRRTLCRYWLLDITAKKEADGGSVIVKGPELSMIKMVGRRQFTESGRWVWPSYQVVDPPAASRTWSSKVSGCKGGRLGDVDTDGGNGSGWCASVASSGAWYEIDAEALKNVVGVALKSRR